MSKNSKKKYVKPFSKKLNEDKEAILQYFGDRAVRRTTAFPFDTNEMSRIYYTIPNIKKYTTWASSEQCVSPPDEYRPERATVHGFECVIYPKGYRLYKGMDGFFTREITEPDRPYWFGENYRAVDFMLYLNGGLNAYELTKPCTLMLQTEPNIRLLYAIARRMRSNQGRRMADCVRYLYGIDLTAREWIEAIERICGYRREADDRICVFDAAYITFPSLCDPEPSSEIYRAYGLENIVIRYFIKTVLDTCGLDGMFCPQAHHPLNLISGTAPVEFILWDNTFRRVTEDPLDWTQWQQYLDFKIPAEGFKLPSDLVRGKNKDHRMIKTYQQWSAAESAMETYPRMRYLSINVHMWQPINGFKTRQDAINGLCELIDRCNPEVVCLYEVPGDSRYELSRVIKNYKIVSWTSEAFGNAILSRIPLAKLYTVRIQPPLPKLGTYHSRWATFFTNRGEKVCMTHLSVGSRDFVAESTRARMQELDNINSHRPNILMGDLNFRPDDPEFVYCQSMGFHYTGSGQATSPFGEIDYVWTLRDGQTSRAIPYVWSDHLPVGLL